MLDSDGPSVLDIMVVPYQEHVLPMIPGGMNDPRIQSRREASGWPRMSPIFSYFA
jgi:hypothetical protein